MAAIINDDSSNNDDSAPLYNKVIDLLKLALKIVILTNGAAAIAILTLIRGFISSSTGFDWVILFLTMAIGSFGFGVLVGILAVVEGYRLVYYKHEYEDAAKAATTKEKRSSELRERFLSQVGSWSELRLQSLAKSEKLIKSSTILFGVGVTFCIVAFLFTFAN